MSPSLLKNPQISRNRPKVSPARAARILMMTYALVSARDPPETTRRSIDSARAHVAAVEHFSRINSTCQHSLSSKILEREMSVRQDWGRISQQNNRLLLSEIITLTSQRFNLWPTISEFKNVYRTIRTGRASEGPPPIPTKWAIRGEGLERNLTTPVA